MTTEELGRFYTTVLICQFPEYLWQQSVSHVWRKLTLQLTWYHCLMYLHYYLYVILL